MENDFRDRKKMLLKTFSKIVELPSQNCFPQYKNMTFEKRFSEVIFELRKMFLETTFTYQNSF